MDVLSTLAITGWILAILLGVAAWFSPRVLLRMKGLFVARADGLTAGRAAYRVAHKAAVDAEQREFNVQRLMHRVCGDKTISEGRR